MAEEASTSKTKKRILSVLQTTSEGQAPLKKSRLVPTGPKYEGEELKLSFHGILYQLHLLTLFLKRGVDRGYTFILGSEARLIAKVNKGEEKTGLIVSATDGKSSRFVHRTYAEFFAARRLANETYSEH
ncbi:unnamed protein product, partial [Iphiclides podalirius]